MLKCSTLLSGSRNVICGQVASVRTKVSTPRVTKLAGRTVRWNYADEINVGDKIYSKDAPPGTHMRIWTCTFFLIGSGVLFFVYAKKDLINKRREHMVARQKEAESQFQAAFQVEKRSEKRPFN